MSIRFRPKRRASIDRTPGPSIARAAPNVANATQLRKSPVLDNADHNSISTTNTPAMGVHKPTKRKNPEVISREGRIIPGHWEPANSSVPPLLIKRTPETSRRSKRPLPGHPLGNIENSRCTETSTTSVGVSQPDRISQYWVCRTPLSRGSQFNDSAFQSNRYRMRSVVCA